MFGFNAIESFLGDHFKSGGTGVFVAVEEDLYGGIVRRCGWSGNCRGDGGGRVGQRVLDPGVGGTWVQQSKYISIYIYI